MSRSIGFESEASRPRFWGQSDKSYGICCRGFPLHELLACRTRNENLHTHIHMSEIRCASIAVVRVWRIARCTRNNNNTLDLRFTACAISHKCHRELMNSTILLLLLNFALSIYYLFLSASWQIYLTESERKRDDVITRFYSHGCLSWKRSLFLPTVALFTCQMFKWNFNFSFSKLTMYFFGSYCWIQMTLYTRIFRGLHGRLPIYINVRRIVEETGRIRAWRNPVRESRKSKTIRAISAEAFNLRGAGINRAGLVCFFQNCI